MKTAVVYCSKHRGNTKKVLDYIAKSNDITLIDAANPFEENLLEYDVIGFASGIYYSKFHKSVLDFAKKHLPNNKKVFFLYTCGAKKDTYTKAVKETAISKSCDILGEFGCLGFDTFGPFKLVGGIAKGHPNDDDFRAALAFFNSVVK